MKVVFNSDEVLQLVLGALQGPTAQNMLPPAMDTDRLWARFTFDDRDFVTGIEVSDERDKDAHDGPAAR